MPSEAAAGQRAAASCFGERTMTVTTSRADVSAQPPLDALFKGAMRRLASGVALVTTADAAGTPYGIAMTAFMSLSMEPPSMLLAINTGASLCAPLLAHGAFAVNILAWEQREGCQTFVSTPADQRFATMPWRMERGVPVVSASVATIICAVDQAEAFGSHTIVKGLVERVMLGDDTVPLTYLDGRYGRVGFDV
ncbi:flavin reductase family protein [Novosphingobium sp. NBM11]|nr:flavin reductase family protein [Novosphingobium sp. NBM11]